MALEGRAQRILNQMQAEGKLLDLSKESFDKINYNVAVEFAPIKKEFEQKDRSSRVYIANLESGKINSYKSNNFYQKVKNYLSNVFNKYVNN